MTSAPVSPDLLSLASAAQDLLFREAHTAHAFTDEPVGEEAIAAVFDLIKYAPTSLNSQPLRGVLVRPGAARERLVELMNPNNRAKTGQAPLTAILAADLDFHETLPRLVPHLPNARDFFADPKTRHEGAVLNAALQIGYFVLGVRAAGLAAGPMSGFDAEGVAKEFFPDEPYRPLVVVNIGHPAPDAFRPRAPRLEFTEVFRTV
ncbi:malonic semialdehyde reductase [Streptacidiphilus sp. MAP5-3]|uniref:malonic semialdehyde reductase n=1 Tax=unclassified Streptacidiphilus TaxID=2643834 RepID=UPI003511F2AA